MTSNKALMERRQLAIPRGVGNNTPLFADRAQNAEVWDVEGQRYVDFASGIAVVNTGHVHPKVKAAVQAQLERFSHTCFHVMMYEPYVELAERLNRLVPGESPKKTLLVNSGAEAVENAIKFARAATGRSGIIAFGGGFHGRTMMAVSLTGKIEPYKAGFGPFPASVFHATYPNELYGVSVDDALRSVEQLFKSDIEPTQVGAMVIEPVQGEGGFYVAPPEFLQKLRVLCDRHGILLIVDEVQTGFGRTGRLFATEYAGIEPDMMTLAKGMAGGFPLAAVVGKAEILDKVSPGGVGGTYGGNPISCAAALAVLDVMEEEDLPARAEAQGALLQGRLRKLAKRFPFIGDVRGKGAMVAIELFHGRAPEKPAADLTKALVARACERGLLLLSCGHNGNVIRILAPLTAPDAVLEEGLDLLEAALEEVAPSPSVAEA